MNKKMIIGISVGVVLLGGIGYYLYTRKAKNGNDVVDPNADIEDAIVVEGDEITIEGVDEVKATPSATPNATALTSNQWKMGYLSARPNGAGAVHLLARPKKGTIKAGDNVKITNTSFDNTYPVKSVWIDKNGNVGALYLDIKGYTPTGNADRKFQDIGVITKL